MNEHRRQILDIGAQRDRPAVNRDHPLIAHHHGRDAWNIEYLNQPGLVGLAG